MKKRILLIALLVFKISSAQVERQGSQNWTAVQSTVVPAFKKIVLVIGENTNASSVLGNTTDAPYINSLAAAGASFTQSFAIEHPSQPNYLDLFSGSNQGITNDNLPASHFTTANLASELISAGKTFKTYSEDLPNVGYDGSTSGGYARKHNPAANWMGTGVNQIPTTTNQPFSAFPSDPTLLPDVSFVIPNLCDDGHDVCAPYNNRTKQYDAWLEANIEHYKKWCILNNSLLIVTFDEDDFTSTNQIATVFYGGKVVQTTYTQPINHYNVLRTLEEAMGLTTHAGAAANATSITYCWTPARLAEQNNSSAPELKLYPNPATSSVTIEGNGTMLLCDVTGRVLSTSLIEEKQEIDLSSYGRGIYFVRLNDKVLRLVKQ